MRIVVFGSTGLAGRAIASQLRKSGHDVVCPLREVPRDPEDKDSWEWEGDKYYADLTNYKSAYDCIRGTGIYVPVDAVVVAAGSVGGIQFNMENQLRQWYINQAIGMNTIAASYECGIKKLIYLASSCCYPSNVDCNMTESMFGASDMLEPTNKGYATAKINCARFAESIKSSGFDYVTLVPTNLYGDGDNYENGRSHVVAALIRKAIEARAGSGIMTVWGSGSPVREFLHSSDLASAVEHVLGIEKPEALYNVGTGVGHCITILASLIAEILNVRIDYDTSKPDGMRRKVMDVSRIESTGWKAETSLAIGLEQTIANLLESKTARGWKQLYDLAQAVTKINKPVDSVLQSA
jgi:GDP-L-fucose synthase